MKRVLVLSATTGYQIRSFHHGVEAYKIADVLAREGISASIWSDWGGFKMEALDGVKANVGLTHVAGARTIVHSDDPSYSQRLNQEAAKSLAAGRLAGLSLTEEDAIRLANDTMYGLAAGVWAGTQERALAIARRLRAGQVDVNGARFNALAPFGGYKQSGIGRELGPYGLEEYLQIKSIQR